MKLEELARAKLAESNYNFHMNQNLNDSHVLEGENLTFCQEEHGRNRPNSEAGARLCGGRRADAAARPQPGPGLRIQPSAVATHTPASILPVSLHRMARSTPPASIYSANFARGAKP